LKQNPYVKYSQTLYTKPCRALCMTLTTWHVFKGFPNGIKDNIPIMCALWKTFEPWAWSLALCSKRRKLQEKFEITLWQGISLSPFNHIYSTKTKRWLLWSEPKFGHKTSTNLHISFWKAQGILSMKNLFDVVILTSKLSSIHAMFKKLMWPFMCNLESLRIFTNGF
jgi:hypothetical protein